MKTFFKKYFILFIVAIAFFLRVNQISSNPPSLSWDEVSIGYNAYSILKTGKDEHQRILPLDTFVAYGDYKPPLPIYLTVPFVAVFGLNELSVRLPSALFGTITVLLTYLLVKELFSNLKTYKLPAHNAMYSVTGGQPIALALLSSLLLAFSPWHINLSRAGFEANIALFFVVLGVLLVFKAFNRPKFWIVALIPFTAAIYTFNSSRYFAPFLVFGLLVFGWQHVRKHIRYFLIGACVFLVLLLPIVPHLLSKEARLRYDEVNIFSDPSIVLSSNQRIEVMDKAWWAKIVFNRRIGYARSYILHFFDHFQPDYLFIKGDGNPKFSIQDVGQLYSIEAPFLVIGIFAMLIINAKLALFLLFWIIASIIPAAVARETPHALRTLNSLPTWQIFTAFGLLQLINYDLLLPVSKAWIVNWRKIRMSIIVIICFIYFFSCVYYLHNYYRHYPKEFSNEWQYGYKQALEYVRPIEHMYNTIYMTELIGRPYMYTLFFNKIDPHEFFTSKESSFDAAGFYHVYGFDKYRFVKEMPTECHGKCLFISPAGGHQDVKPLLKTIYLLNGNPVLDIYEK